VTLYNSTMKMKTTKSILQKSNYKFISKTSE